MPACKRSDTNWYEVIFLGKRSQESAKTGGVDQSLMVNRILKAQEKGR